MNNKLDRARAILEDTEKTLDEFEARYGMGSEEFLAAFNKGDLPETEAYYRWRTLHAGIARPKARIEEIEGVGEMK